MSTHQQNPPEVLVNMELPVIAVNINGQTWVAESTGRVAARYDTSPLARFPFPDGPPPDGIYTMNPHDRHAHHVGELEPQQRQFIQAATEAELGPVVSVIGDKHDLAPTTADRAARNAAPPRTPWNIADNETGQVVGKVSGFAVTGYTEGVTDLQYRWGEADTSPPYNPNTGRWQTGPVLTATRSDEPVIVFQPLTRFELLPGQTERWGMNEANQVAGSPLDMSDVMHLAEDLLAACVDKDFDSFEQVYNRYLIAETDRFSILEMVVLSVASIVASVAPGKLLTETPVAEGRDDRWVEEAARIQQFVTTRQASPLDVVDPEQLAWLKSVLTRLRTDPTEAVLAQTSVAAAYLNACGVDIAGYLANQKAQRP